VQDYTLDMTEKNDGANRRDLKADFMNKRRSIRMRQFCERMHPFPGMRILDLGGSASIWQHVEVPLNLTILNLDADQLIQQGKSQHETTFLQGDACDVRQYQDGQFDLVFSNSVIEHVGPEPKQAAFAREVRRLGRDYWVQTPSRWFPIEAHCSMPFWWFYPDAVRRWFIKRWRPRLPSYTEMVEGTRVLRLGDLRRLFPDGELYVEFAYSLPKSYTVYRTSRRL
jgi:Methyltransferase domain